MINLRSFYQFSVLSMMSVFLLSCGGGAGHANAGSLYDPGYGPFDKKGNYLEREADKTARQKRTPSMNEPAVIASKKSAPTNTSSTSSSSTTQKTSSSKTTTSTQAKSTNKVVKVKPSVKVAPSVLYHKVSKGETLYAISRKYSTSVASIQSVNRLKGNIIHIGQTLKIPQ